MVPAEPLEPEGHLRPIPLPLLITKRFARASI